MVEMMSMAKWRYIVVAAWTLALWNVFLLPCCVSSADVEISNDEGEPPSLITELTLETFDATIESHDLLVVEFYAPWCGACKKFAPKYDQVAQTLEGIVPLFKFDAWKEEHAALNSKYNVSGYPTIVILQKNKDTKKHEVPYIYSGDLEAEALLDILNRKMRPDYVELATLEDVTSFTDNLRVSIVGFFDSKDSDGTDKSLLLMISLAFQAFVEVAKKMKEDFLFAVLVGNREAAEEFSVVAPSAVIFKTFDEDRVVLEGSKLSELEDLIHTHNYPLLAEIGKENSKVYVKSGIPIGFMFVETAAQRKELTPLLKDIAKDTRRKLNFVFIDWEKYGAQAEKLALKGDRVPAFSIEDTKERLQYAMNEDVTEVSLRLFVSKFLNGELKPNIISEAIPETNDELVKIVVADSFKEMVLDSPKNVFLEFYAPWCGHCKSLKPIWEELAQHFADRDDIVIAKIDSTLNVHDPHNKIGTYPTLRLYPAGDKSNFIQHSGERDLPSLIAWLTEKLSPATPASKPKEEL